jgi:hypothetical protein
MPRRIALHLDELANADSMVTIALINQQLSARKTHLLVLDGERQTDYLTGIFPSQYDVPTPQT